MVKSRLFLGLQAAVLLVAGLTFTTPQIAHAQKCEALFGQVKKTQGILAERGQDLPQRQASLQALAKFAEANKLPYKWVDFGPADRKVRRLMVAIDIKNAKLMEAYRKTFNLESELNNQGHESTLVIEQTWESNQNPEHYVYTYIRADAGKTDNVYRWGRRDMTWEDSFSSVKDHAEGGSGLIGLAHLIEVNPKERDNVKIFLDTPDQRGKCKSDNCVAWLTGTELGVTAKKATDDARKYLFNELGISRTIAPFEIARRLTHAANDRHSAIAVFVDGAKGLKSFTEALDKNLIPEPKIPYAAIIKNYTTANPAQKAVDAVIADGDKIFLPIAAGASPDAVEAIVNRSAALKKGVDLHVLVNGVSAQTFKKGVETTDGKFRVHALFLGGNLRELYTEKKVSVVPGNLSDFTRMMRDPNQSEFHYNAILVRVSPPNSKGFHSLGPNHDMIMTILRDRPDIKVIAEVNPNIPFTNGDNRIHKNRINAKFESNTELAGPATVPANDVDVKIGSNLGKLINSGATLQVGIGNIFGGLAAGLKKAKKNNITISTEMFGDHMMQMMKDGTATKAETGFAFGSGNLYKWLDKNRDVKFVSTEYVNSPGRVAETPNFHAVNTALQVDLYGQVNATMGPNGRISSPGGQVEFMSGASRSEGGKAIIAIRSTAKDGTISSITLNLYQGPITTPHENVSHVVTEYGVADIRGKSERDRAMSLISIAHPNFRAQLAQQAVDAAIITTGDMAAVLGK